MKITSKQFCPYCKSPMIYVDHYEVDDDLGSHEPYFECVNNCDEQGTIETCTEYGDIMYGLIMTEESGESLIL